MCTGSMRDAGMQGSAARAPVPTAGGGGGGSPAQWMCDCKRPARCTGACGGCKRAAAAVLVRHAPGPRLPQAWETLSTARRRHRAWWKSQMQSPACSGDWRAGSEDRGHVSQLLTELPWLSFSGLLAPSPCLLASEIAVLCASPGQHQPEHQIRERSPSQICGLSSSDRASSPAIAPLCTCSILCSLPGRHLVPTSHPGRLPCSLSDRT